MLLLRALHNHGPMLPPFCRQLKGDCLWLLHCMASSSSQLAAVAYCKLQLPEPMLLTEQQPDAKSGQRSVAAPGPLLCVLGFADFVVLTRLGCS